MVGKKIYFCSSLSNLFFIHFWVYFVMRKQKNVSKSKKRKMSVVQVVFIVFYVSSNLSILNNKIKE